MKKIFESFKESINERRKSSHIIKLSDGLNLEIDDEQIFINNEKTKKYITFSNDIETIEHFVKGLQDAVTAKPSYWFALTSDEGDVLIEKRGSNITITQAEDDNLTIIVHLKNVKEITNNLLKK